MFLFRDHVSIDRFNLDRLREFNKFTIKIYLQYWFTSMNAVMAPYNDLRLLKDIISYENVNKKVSAAAFNKFSNHLWYLNEALVGLAFFDDRVDLVEKRSMVKALKNSGSSSYESRKSLKKEEVIQKQLSHFVTSNTLEFLKEYEVDVEEWISVDPALWKENDYFLKAKDFFQHLSVVNDCAERGVKLASEYVNKFKEEKSMQEILQVTEQNRRMYSDSNKKTLLMSNIDNLNGRKSNLRKKKYESKQVVEEKAKKSNEIKRNSCQKKTRKNSDVEANSDCQNEGGLIEYLDSTQRYDFSSEIDTSQPSKKSKTSFSILKIGGGGVLRIYLKTFFLGQVCLKNWFARCSMFPNG